jgi:RNAse (barnase) inhibitor barstar
MEYRTEEENGDAAWYKLIGNRNTPVKVVHTAAQRKYKMGVRSIYYVILLFPLMSERYTRKSNGQLSYAC